MSLFPTPENSPRSLAERSSWNWPSAQAQAGERTRLSSQAAPFQPQPPRAHSTTWYAVPPTRYVTPGTRPVPSVPSVPSVSTAQQGSFPAWSWDEATPSDPKVPPVILGSEMLPSLGSGGHATGECKPCAFFYKKAGCASGRTCLFCHLCENGEKKRRQRESKKDAVTAKPGLGFGPPTKAQTPVLTCAR